MAKTIAAFGYMILEGVLGKTKHGSVLGLAKAIFSATLGFVVDRVLAKFKKSPDVPAKSTPETKEEG